MKHSPFKWRRGPRSTFSLGAEAGLYALFLREGAKLPGITPGECGLIYIGLAAAQDGLKGRCHFDARTGNHSPRKSLAVILLEKLALSPVLIPKPNASDTWGLDGPSDARLSAWMHANLELAIEACPNPDGRETELVGHYAPPLNLTKCVQTGQHRWISQARVSLMAELQEGRGSTFRDNLNPEYRHASATANLIQPSPSSAHRIVGPDIDTAEAIAARYGLNPKSYRQRMRSSISWYRKHQDWSFPVDSTEWRDMIAIAEKMGG